MTKDILKRRFKTTISRALNFIRLIDKPRHLSKISKARRVVNRLAVLAAQNAEEPQILAYLRKVESDVFEEVVLELYERQGHIVLRNTRYTGDGGIDGRVYLPLGLTAIQCKRYSSHISPEHVRQFGLVASRFAGGGIFVHTGKTGESSYQALARSNLLLISGFDLARMASSEVPIKIKTQYEKRALHTLVQPKL